MAKAARGGKILFDFQVPVTVLHGEKSGQDRGGRSWHREYGECCLLACSPGHAPPAFLYNPGHLSRNGPHQSSTMKMPQEAFPQAILMEEFFSTHVPFSQMTQWVSSWPKANQHMCDLTTLAPITMFNHPHYDEQRFWSNVTLNSSLLQKQLFRAGV